MADKLTEMQIAFVNILSIAINTLDVDEKNEYLKEQRKIIQQDLAIENDEEGKIIELEHLPQRN